MKKGSNTGLLIVGVALAAFGIYSVTANTNTGSDGLTTPPVVNDPLKSLRLSVINLINSIPSFSTATRAKMVNAVNVMTSTELNDMYTILTNVKNGKSISAMDTITKVLAINTKYQIFNV
jgi:hypothetical protein